MDPDKSVARGAVVYHYFLHHEEKVSAIMYETVGIELAGNKVHHMIPAGTALPCESPIQFFEINKSGPTSLRISLFLGRRKDTTAPNRQIADRVFEFDRPLQSGEEIAIQLSVDESNVIKLKGWFTNNPENSFEDVTYKSTGFQKMSFPSGSPQRLSTSPLMIL